MQIVLKHILKNIWEKKGRSLLIILSLIVASTVFVLNVILPDEILLKIEETLRTVYGNADIEISSLETFKLEDLKRPDDEITYTGYLNTEIYIGDSPALVMGIDINTAKELRLLNKDVPDLKENEVVINKTEADKNSYEVGQIIKVTYDEKDYDLKIVAIVENKGLNAIDIGNPIFISNLETTKVIENVEDGIYDGLYIDMDDDKVSDYVEYLKDNNENFTTSKLLDIESLREQTQMISSIMMLIFVLSAIMIFFVVNSLNKIVIAERMPVIGTFRSVGATKNKMNYILVLENAVYGLIGGIIGTIIAYAVSSKAAGIFVVAKGVELSSETSKFSIPVLILGIVFTILLEIFISINAIRKANKKPVKEIIFDVQSTRYNIKKSKIIAGSIMFILAIAVNALNTKSNVLLTLISIILLITGINYLVPLLLRGLSKCLTFICKKIGFSTGVISCKNIAYNKMIIASSRLIVISLALILSIMGISVSFADALETFKHVAKDANIIVEGTGKSYKEYENLVEVKDVEDVSFILAYMDGDITYNDGKRFKNVPMFVGEKDSISYIKEYDYKIKDLKDGEVLIDEKYKITDNLDVGDTLKLKFSTNKEMEFKVVGFINSANFTVSRCVFIVNWDYYIENINDIPMQIHLKINDDADVEEVKRNVDKKIKEMGIEISSFDEFMKKQKDQIGGILSLFYIVVGFAIALSFIGIINNQIISFLQRKKELAVLNSTCMSKGQLASMLFFETVFSSIFACIIGIFVGFISTTMIDNFMKSLMIYIEMNFDWQVALTMAGIILGVLLLTLIAPIHKLKKMNIVDQIKYE